MSARVTSSVVVGALMRRAEAEGGFAAVLAKGDATAGSIALVLTERGQETRIYERLLESDGRYRWQPIESNAVAEFVARRRRFDPDLWVLELDIPSAERFAAEMNDIA